MKQVCQKISACLKTVFGWGVFVCLIGGGLTFFGYLAALIVGGEWAALICTALYKNVMPVLVYASTVLVLLGLVAMYFSGEMALTAGEKKSK